MYITGTFYLMTAVLTRHIMEATAAKNRNKSSEKYQTGILIDLCLFKY